MGYCVLLAYTHLNLIHFTALAILSPKEHHTKMLPFSFSFAEIANFTNI